MPSSLPPFPPLTKRPSLAALEEIAQKIEDEYVDARRVEREAQSSLEIYEAGQDKGIITKREKDERVTGSARPMSQAKSDDSRFTYFSNRSENDLDPERAARAAKLRADIEEAARNSVTRKMIHDLTQDKLKSKRTSGEFYLSNLRDDQLSEDQQRDLFEFSEKKTNHYERQLDDPSLDSTVIHRHKGPWHELRSRLGRKFKKEESRSRGRTSKSRSVSTTRQALDLLGIGGSSRTGSPRNNRRTKPEQS